MPGTSLQTLLARNRAHVDALPEGHFAAVQDGQRPPVVSLCCSDSRVPQAAMFDADEPGWLFTVATIGNAARAVVDGVPVVDGNLLYPLQHTDTRTVAVVGHTGCGAVTAAHEAVRGEAGELAPGIRARVGLLEPVVERALDGEVDDGGDPGAVVDRLVEANVHEQVAFLRGAEAVPDDAHVYGFVYDLHGRYGGPRGRTVLVNADGERDPDRLRERVPADHQDSVGTLLG